MILSRKFFQKFWVQFGLILLVPFLYQGISYLIGVIFESRFEELSKVFVSRYWFKTSEKEVSFTYIIMSAPFGCIHIKCNISNWYYRFKKTSK